MIHMTRPSSKNLATVSVKPFLNVTVMRWTAHIRSPIRSFGNLSEGFAAFCRSSSRHPSIIR